MLRDWPLFAARRLSRCPPRPALCCTAGEALRHQLLEPGGAQEAHSMVEGILGGAMMHARAGGWFPDAASMLAQQGLAAA